MKKSILCKILSVMLILAMAFTLAACAAKPAETTEPAETTARPARKRLKKRLRSLPTRVQQSRLS